jgi:predicted ATP-dependent endonuclease of OLD family
MRLSIKNIGKLSQADIEINGITVIAGENNTGKSTVGKILFCVFNSFYKIDKRTEGERKSNIEKNIAAFYFIAMDDAMKIRESEIFAEKIIQKKEFYLENKERLKEDMRQLFTLEDKNFNLRVKCDFLTDSANKIIQIFNVSDHEIFVTLFKKMIRAEFNMQLNNIRQPHLSAQITLQVKNAEIKASIRGNTDIDVEYNIKLDNEVIYMDDPFILDDVDRQLAPMYTFFDDDILHYTDHRKHLMAKLLKTSNASGMKGAIDEIIVTKKLGEIFEKLNSICEGEISIEGKDRWAYKESDVGPSLDLLNVSTGLKPFIIIKTLLLNGDLEENGILVLDEPEIHLHPEWQLIFAELIVLIQKEFHMRVLINTHSPYFLDAIDVFSHKHGNSDRCKYYLAEKTGETACITDVSDEIDKIYAKLSRPLQVLENEGYR